MKIYLYDNSGHPFQVQLSRSLAARGHEVTHSSFAELQTPKGNLPRHPDAPYSFLIEVINSGEALNRNDGGSTAFKLVAEFGVFAIVFAFRLLRQAQDSFIIILSMYLLVTMIRGASYFYDAVGISVGLLMFAPVLAARARKAREQLPTGQGAAAGF